MLTPADLARLRDLRAAANLGPLTADLDIFDEGGEIEATAWDEARFLASAGTDASVYEPGTVTPKDRAGRAAAWATARASQAHAGMRWLVAAHNAAESLLADAEPTVLLRAIRAATGNPWAYVMPLAGSSLVLSGDDTIGTGPTDLDALWDAARRLNLLEST